MLESKRTQIELNLNKSATKRFLPALVLGLAVAWQCQAATPRLATNLERYSLRAVMTNNTVEPKARGTISGSLSSSGSVESQLLTISLTKLTTNTTYTLIAFVDASPTATVLTNFTTDRRGSFSVSYWKRTKGTSRGQPLPGDVDPITNLRELDVTNAGGAIVLQAMVVNPDRISYLVRRNMDNTGLIPTAIGTLQISGSHQSTHLRLAATGLTPLTEYLIAINGNVVATNTSDTRGRVTLAKLPVGSPNFMDIQSVSLANSAGVIALISTDLGIPNTYAPVAEGSLVLGTAATYAVLAGSTVTSTGNTVVTGDVGVWAGSAVNGFAGIVPGGPGVVHGTIHAGDAAAQTAQGDLTTAYNDAAGRTLAPVDVANADLGGRTLAPGLYKSTGTLALTGTLTLDAQGDANGVFIFQIASSLDTASGSKVILSGSAKASNVFWQVGSSATLGTTTAFKGTIMANQSISLANGATLQGRALASIGAVTMDDNAITLPPH
jgi:hypothetical protein